MAGDWIKMRVDLAADPAVIAIAAATGLDEYGVIGRLHKAWSWAEQQSRDGHVPNVTGAWLDKYVEHPGFAKAMAAVGWLTVLSTGLSFPRFERHNGKPAKDRALARDRKVTQRSRSERDSTVTREEKRRDSSLKQHHEPQAPEASKPPAAAGEAKPPTPPLEVIGAGHMAKFRAACAAHQVTGVKPEHFERWVHAGVTVQQLERALATCRSPGRKPMPERLTVGYVEPILTEICEQDRAARAAAKKRNEVTQELLARQREEATHTAPMPEALKPRQRAAPAPEPEPPPDDDPEPPAGPRDGAPVVDDVALEERDWWRDDEGIVAAANDYGVLPMPGQDFGEFTARVLAARGHGPWMEAQPQSMLDRIGYWQAMGVNSQVEKGTTWVETDMGRRSRPVVR